MSSSTAAAAAHLVILKDPTTWDPWYDQTRGSVPQQLWRYFSPESDLEFQEPNPPIEPIEEAPPEGAEPPNQQNAREIRNQRRQDVFFRAFTIYRENERKWELFNKESAKLREKIYNTVDPSKRPLLLPERPIREWLTTLRNKTALPAETIRLNIQLDYQKHVGTSFLEWPAGGPAAWLAK